MQDISVWKGFLTSGQVILLQDTCEDCYVQPAQECQEVLGDVSHDVCFYHDFLQLDFVDLGVEKLWAVDAGLRTCTCTTTRDLGCFFVASKLEMFVWKLV